MRLLQFYDNGDFRLTNFSSEDVPFYGILSHRWGADGDEITYEELMDGNRRSINDSQRLGFRKLRFCQERAAQDGLRYFWIDTCCINKLDLTELSSSLNSMFYWYQKAARCYVYLFDVSYSAEQGYLQNMAFEDSTWFTRGWTLQELIAPSSVVFYSQQGARLGDKISMEKTIHQITKIPIKALRGSGSLSEFSVDERFSWAEHRQTKRPEDFAYCLLGIFDVWMTPVYTDGDAQKLRGKAIKELRKKIEEGGVVQDVIRIGGASWSDLAALNEKELQELDKRIRRYTDWFVQQGQPPTQDNLRRMSVDAGRKMRELLNQFEVEYNDDSDLQGRITTWQEPWKRFLHRQSKFERVRAFVENRWCVSNGTEGFHTSITAAKTLLGLIVWRGMQDLR